MQTRPALKVLAIFVLGILFARNLDFSPLLIFSFALFSFFGAFTLWYAEKGSLLARDFLLALGLISVGFVSYAFSTGHFPANHISHFTNLPEIVAIRGEIIRYPEQRPNKLSLIVATTELASPQGFYKTSGAILVNVYDLETAHRYGDEIVIRGKLGRPKDRRNPGEFDYREYLMAQGIFGTVSVYQKAQIKTISSGNGNWFFKTLVLPVKTYLDEFVEMSLPKQEAALLRGLLIGERGEISTELRESFAKLGVIHILAVSGLHVGFIILIFMGVLGLFRIPYAFRVVLTILGLIFYAYLTNLKPPVVRAATMGGIVLFGTLLERKTDVYNSLALAALLILIVNPLELFQPGFQLSFTAVTAIVYIYPKLKSLGLFKKLYEKVNRFGILRYPVELLFVSIAAFLGTLPFTILYFNRLPSFSIIANIFIIPLSFMGLANSIIAAFFNIFMPFLADIYMAAAGICLYALIKLVDWGSQIPFAFWEIYEFSTWRLFFYAATLILLLNLYQKWAKRWLFILTLFVANIFVWRTISQDTSEMKVTFLDVGQGDAVLFTLPDKRHILIDGGPRGRFFDAGEWVIAPFLKRQGIGELHAIVLSHADADHLGGFPYLMRNFKIHEVWDNGESKDTRLYQEYSYLVDSLKIKHRLLYAGDVIGDFAPVQIFVVHPTQSFTESNDSHNDGSLSLKISFREMDFLLAGDVEKLGEAQISQFDNLLESEVLKVSHHGSRTSSTQQFLDCVKPELAVISVGALNRFDHPHPGVLQRLNAMGARILRTDREAAIILKTDGKEIKRVNWK